MDNNLPVERPNKQTNSLPRRPCFRSYCVVTPDVSIKELASSEPEFVSLEQEIAYYKRIQKAEKISKSRKENNKQKIIKKLKTLKLFKFNNKGYIERLIEFLEDNEETNELLNKGNASNLFNNNLYRTISDLFDDIQADGNMWCSEKELAKFIMIDYTENDDEDYYDSYNIIYLRFIDKIRNSFV